MRERTKPPGGKEFEQVVEFTEFDRPRRVHTLGPLAARIIARQFRGYHENLRRNLEAG
jgi:hypothetical protein